MVINTSTRLQQVKAYLLDYIRENQLQRNDQLPSEAAIAKQLGVSRNTLREAYVSLENEGIIVRRHGVGTFVTDSRVIRDSLNEFSPFAQIVQDGGYTPHFRTLSMSHECAPADVCDVFDIPASTKLRRIKRRFPHAHVLVRGDSGFCVPKLLRVLERLDQDFGDVDYIFGIARNPVLERLAEPALAAAAQMFEVSRMKIRHFTEFEYAAGTWRHRRLVVAKAEHGSLGPNPRFVLTSLRGFPPELIYRAYCERGRCENLIKDLKNALNADRLSCSSFKANFFRLLLHGAAYRLMHELRNQASEHSDELARAQFDTLRLRILKIAALIRQSVRRIHVRLPLAFPFARIFRAIAAGLDPPPLPA